MIPPPEEGVTAPLLNPHPRVGVGFGADRLRQIGAGPSSAAGTPPGAQVDASGMPDYSSLIGADPGYLSWLNNSQLTHADEDSKRRAAMRALAIRYGGLPAGFQDTYGDIDPTTRDIASRNPFSQIASESKASADRLFAMKRALAGRGGLHSGDLGYGLRQEDYQHGQNEYDLGQGFGEAANAAFGGYLGSEATLRGQQVDQLAAAAARVRAAYPASPGVAPGTAPAAQPGVPMHAPTRSAGLGRWPMPNRVLAPRSDGVHGGVL